MSTSKPDHKPTVTRAIGRLAVIALATLSGCSSEERVNTVSVLAESNCQGVSEGITEVTLADIARLRGSELVGAETSATSSTEPLPLLISISRGPQPSRGFEMHLADQARMVSPTALALDVYWTAPDNSKPQPLVTTTPCLVVSVPAGPWERIEAVDQKGETVGALTRSP